MASSNIGRSWIRSTLCSKFSDESSTSAGNAIVRTLSSPGWGISGRSGLSTRVRFIPENGYSAPENNAR
jgi:hypothetical protein